MTLDDFSRRNFLKVSAAGALTGSMSGWMEALSVRADADTRQKSCILLWMGGGPSHLDTFDLKPDAPADVRGELNRPIETSVPGIRICENFPRFARQIQHAALIRSMTTTEGEHSRAHYHVHTGYSRGAGGVAYPSIGSIVSAELGRPDYPMPSYVWMGPLGDHKIGNEWDFRGSGFLGPRHQPLVVRDPGRGVENLRPEGTAQQVGDRLSLLDQMQEGFLKTHPAPAVVGQTTTVQRTVRLMHANEARAFDLSQAPIRVRDSYGRTRFGDACLMARQLLEAGVPFVEVGHGGWDTHGFGGNCFAETRDLSRVVDAGMAALTADLHSRGLLDSTLVVWMGEFGRTPRIDGAARVDGSGTARGVGRGHHPRAWTSVLIGGGIRGGQVIGRTDRIGGSVEDRPVTIHDFMATLCRILGIDYTKENTSPGGRPVRIVDRNPTPIRELFA